MNNPVGVEKPVSRGVYFLSVLSFIPLVGVLLGLISIIFGFKQKQRGGLWVAAIGFAGIVFNVVIYGYLFFQMNNPTGSFAESQIQLTQKVTLPDLVRRIEYYKIQNGRYPKQIDDLGDEVAATIKLNENNTIARIVYELAPEEKTYYLLAVGKDGKPFTADDIFPEISDAEMPKIGFRKNVLAR